MFVFHYLQSTFQFALTWSVGGTVDTDGRTKFDAYMREIISGKSEEFPMPADVGQKIEVPMPDNGLVYDFVYEVSMIVPQCHIFFSFLLSIKPYNVAVVALAFLSCTV